MTPEPHVGQVVPRHAVPSHALVRETGGDRCYAVRLGSKGLWVGGPASWTGCQDEIPWEWGLAWEMGEVEIVALDLRGDETVEELRDLADRHEVAKGAES